MSRSQWVFCLRGLWYKINKDKSSLLSHCTEVLSASSCIMLTDDKEVANYNDYFLSPKLQRKLTKTMLSIRQETHHIQMEGKIS